MATEKQTTVVLYNYLFSDYSVDMRNTTGSSELVQS